VEHEVRLSILEGVFDCGKVEYVRDLVLEVLRQAELLE